MLIIYRRIIVLSVLCLAPYFAVSAQDRKETPANIENYLDAKEYEVNLIDKKKSDGASQKNKVINQSIAAHQDLSIVEQEAPVTQASETQDAAETPANSSKNQDQPIVVDADSIEYSQDKTTVTANGNVKIVRDNTVLTCDKISVNTQTNDAHAEGNVVLKDKQGVIKAKVFDYNFKNKTGQAYDAHIIYPPYFGSGRICKKISETEIEINNGYITTCDNEHPHYKIASRMVEIYPQEKVTTRGMTFRVANTPILYMPKYTQNLKDDRMHVEVTPGKSKDWGLFILTAWRYDLLNNSTGRVHVDFREKRDLAWGVDNYYDTKIAGKGFFRTYYMHERKLGRSHLYKYPKELTPEKSTKEKERYRIQWRHKWDLSDNTYTIAQYHKVRDAAFIKDYFYREYEKNIENVADSNLSFTHNFPEIATLSFLMQKRTNRIFSETEKLPEIILQNPHFQIYDLPIYLSNTASYTNFNSKQASPSDFHQHADRYDLNDIVSMPFKLSFLDMNTFVGARHTYYTRISGKEEPVFREAWNTGIDVSTRFYRIFDVTSDLWGIKVNKLRHIISPVVNYGYTHQPTVASSKIYQFDSADSISQSNSMNFSLESKLQTKRDGDTVDFLRLLSTSNYSFNTESARRKLSDNITFTLDFLPYNWLNFRFDGNFLRKTKRHFTTASFDLSADGKEIDWKAGYRYERKSSSQFTGEIAYKLFKGWEFTIYERLQFKGSSLFKEQNYKISKDLHCWILDINYSVLRERGETFWFAFRLKAFPELTIDYGQNYHEPKPGSQG